MNSPQNVAFVCFCVSVATVLAGDNESSTELSSPPTNEHERSIKRNNTWILEACATENNITLDDFRTAGSGVHIKWPSPPVNTRAVNCTVSCVLRKRNAIVDGQLSMEGIILDAQNYFNFSGTLKSAFLNATKICYNKAQSVTDECDLGYFFDTCSSFQFLFSVNEHYEGKKYAKETCLEKNNVTFDVFQKNSALSNVSYAEKCVQACLLREQEGIVDGKFSFQLFNFFVEQFIYQSNYHTVYKKIIENCPKRVEPVTDECEMAFIVRKCLAEEYSTCFEDADDFFGEWKCATKNDISQQYDTIVNRLRENPTPESHAEKCLIGCAFRSKNMIVNGKLSLENWKQKVQNCKIIDQEKMSRIMNIYDICTKRAESLNDDCSIGDVVSTCFMEQRRNFTTPFPDV